MIYSHETQTPLILPDLSILDRVSELGKSVRMLMPPRVIPVEELIDLTPETEALTYVHAAVEASPLLPIHSTDIWVYESIALERLRRQENAESNAIKIEVTQDVLARQTSELQKANDTLRKIEDMPLHNRIKYLGLKHEQKIKRGEAGVQRHATRTRLASVMVEMAALQGDYDHLEGSVSCLFAMIAKKRAPTVDVRLERMRRVGVLQLNGYLDIQTAQEDRAGYVAYAMAAHDKAAFHHMVYQTIPGEKQIESGRAYFEMAQHLALETAFQKAALWASFNEVALLDR